LRKVPGTAVSRLGFFRLTVGGGRHAGEGRVYGKNQKEERKEVKEARRESLAISRQERHLLFQNIDGVARGIVQNVGSRE